ncbi:MAG: CehA/McbA family metallohydrolase [Gemmatimonadota bacterium]
MRSSTVWAFRCLLLFPAVLLFSNPVGAQVGQLGFEAFACDGCFWFKGNTHAHTTESDGDSSPEYVAQWYKDHGYDFLILSDHNTLTDPGTLAHLVDDGFLLIPGEEVTSFFEDRAVHVNGLNLQEFVAPRQDSTLIGTIQANVDAVREKAGVPHINHPNYGWSMGPDDLASVGGYRLLEIFNGHPAVHNHGGGGFPSMEEVWDILLTRGKRVYGIAVDDAHHFQGEFSPTRINPGRGWVVVKAPDRSAASLMEALEEGRFYSSTGVDLEDVVVEGTRLEVHIRPKGNFKYTTTFFGPGGRVLGIGFGTVAVFDLTGSESYVRARVEDSGGAIAWVQPVFVRAR